MTTENEWSGGYDLHEDPEEVQHLYSVLDSFLVSAKRQYRRAAHFRTTHIRRQYFYALPSAHSTLLSDPPVSFLETLSQLDDAIDTNADLAEKIMRNGAVAMGLADSDKAVPEEDPPWKNAAVKLDHDKARSTLHQLYRDWSAEGNVEREVCYSPVMKDLAVEFPDRLNREIKVLVPGAGLGRLVFDMAQDGYHAEGNEFSYHQLLTSSFILNHTSRAEEWALHPFVMSFANVQRRSDQLRRIMVPDVHPGSMRGTGTMSMTTGDFVNLYRQEEYANAFDAVTTVFFIDTAQNLIKYVETVRNCLRTGGIWSNVGPLLWHFGHHDNGPKDDDASHTETEYGSFELCDEEVVALVQQFGFVLEKHEPCIGQTGYVQNPASMLQSVYRPSHWVVRKG